MLTSNLGQAGFFSFGDVTSLGRKKTKFEPAVLCLKLTMCHILFVVKGLGKYILEINFSWKSRLKS